MKEVEVLTQTGNVADLVELAKREAGLLLLKSGLPVAQVVPVPEPGGQKIAPLHPGAIEASDDFDAPLPDNFWLGKS